MPDTIQELTFHRTEPVDDPEVPGADLDAWASVAKSYQAEALREYAAALREPETCVVCDATRGSDHTGDIPDGWICGTCWARENFSTDPTVTITK